MYNKEFAKIYNTDWAEFSESLVDNVLKIMPNCSSVLDLGCGTGNFLKKIEKFVERTVGIDISENMIEIAKKNCKHSDLYVQSVLSFNFNKKFDLITCNFDMINHLNTIQDWEQMFKLVYKHLNEGGIFLFDFNTLLKMQNMDFLEHSREGEKYRFVGRDTKIDDNHVRMDIQIFNKKGKRLAFVDEIESFYDEKLIKYSLIKCGFKDIKFVDKNFEEIDISQARRIFAICKK